MKDKLIIVGSHTGTRGEIPWEDDVENTDIWTINESATGKNSWVKRVTGILQIHPRAVWDNPKNMNDPHHGEWLKANKTIPVYMIEKYPDVPMAEKYPLREITEKYLGKFNVFGGRNRREFFTTTVGYMAALAAYKGYKQVDFYGVELSVESEYRYQRPGAMFWIGILSQHAEINFHGLMFDAPIYGIEVDGDVDLQMLEDRKAQLLPSLEEHTKTTNELQQKFSDAFVRFQDSGVDFQQAADTFQALMTELQKFGFYSGAVQELDRRIDKARTQLSIDDQFWFSHHEFERDAVAIQTRRAETIVNHSRLAGVIDVMFNYAVEFRLQDSRRKKYMKDLGGALPEFVKLCQEVGIYSGAVEENNLLARMVKKQLLGGT